MAKTGASGITRIINAGKYSMKGFRAAFKNEAAFRQDLLIAVILLIADFFVCRGALQFLLLLSGPFFILLAEIMNSAVEAVVDRIGDEYHELSGRAKDLGSSAVFLMLTYTTVIWAVILIDNYTDWHFA
ncbi:MAG: diacylglycerol kinase [Succinimonas sp.]|jgi:diacylglycerol kinase (ATP)|nr:diacylglycerol kinase [Succinimonas sp.]